MDINKFAPVIIPTLNRYDHFVTCLESLERCKGADKTDVFIGLDYPPADKYIDGWSKIDAYLREKEVKNSFSSLTVFRRLTNCGVGGPNSNSTLLYEYVKERYETYIFSEDDNIFSPNFLEYINKGLILFKNDPKVLAVCGYRFYYPLVFYNNNYFRQNVDFNFWGCGCWVDKITQARKWNHKTLNRKFLNPINIIKVWKTGSYRMNCFLRRTYKKSFDYHDNFYSVYMLLNKMHMIMPAVSKVRNIGWDGSGQNCLGYSDDIIDSHLSQEIDQDQYFDYSGTGWESYKENRDIIIRNDYNKGSFIQTFVMVIYKYLSFIGINHIVRIFRRRNTRNNLK